LEENIENEIEIPQLSRSETIRKKIKGFIKKHYKVRSKLVPIHSTQEMTENPLLRPAEEDPAHDLEKKDFLIKLAKALHVYGSPVYRTEYSLTFASTALGIQGMFAVFPTLLLTSFGDFERDPSKSESHILRVNQGFHCEKLALVDSLADQICERKISLLVAKHELDRIIHSPPRYKSWIKLLSFSSSAACIAPLFFGGNRLDRLFSESFLWFNGRIF
jgi:hypothetical protein